jgi:hypothetical protein
MTIKSLYPSFYPTLDLNFANSRALDPRISFTRGSIATCVGSNGLLQSVARNTARFDHNPTTGESLGLLVEEQRTNSISNNTMVGAVAGTPGTNPTGWAYATAQSNGLTLSIVGTGVENGINYIDYRFNGTTVASPLYCAIGFVNAAAATAQTWTASMYWKLTAGSTTGVTNWQLGLIENTAGGSFVTGGFYDQTAPTSAALITQRPTATRTLSGGATVGLLTYPLGIAVAGNTAIDFTIRIGLPQLEQGAFATSVIPTTTAAATRSADVASISGSNFSSWYRQDEGTVFVRAATFSTGTTLTHAISDGTFNQSIYANFSGGNAFRGANVLDAGVTQANGISTFTGLVASDGINDALAFQANNFGESLNGLTARTDNTGTIPTVDRLFIGSSWAGTGNFLNGTIRRLTYWPTRLSNATLQALTQ